MIVGTAGHVDHGKTSLVRALTGVDADRLAEEKARGMSIDLGFAYLPLPGGAGAIGFVDVPGHERFLHTMLAGAAGIDFVLLVVAADDGIMPQTREHLAILDLLGLGRGLVALTKTDLVPPMRRRAATVEIREALSGTTLAGIDVVPVSAATGDGVAALRERLLREAAAGGAAQPPAGGRLRLAVDRSFALAGIGTVITGTVLSGAVAVGERVVVSPSGLTARVRSIYAQNRAAPTGQAGERCALNLAGDGVTKNAIRRGDAVLDPALHRPTSCLDAELRVLPGAPRPIASRLTVRLHHLAAEIGAHVVPLQDPIAPGAVGWVQLVLDAPIAAAAGDPFILRDAAARQTLGGGRVLDPQASARHRRGPGRLARLAALAQTGSASILAALAAYGLVDLDSFARDRALTDPETDDISTRLDLVRAGRFATTGQRWRALIQGVQDALRRFHADNPESAGIAPERLRLGMAPVLQAHEFAVLMREMLRRGDILKAGGGVCLPGHRPRLGAVAEALFCRIRPLLGGEMRFRPPRVRDLAATLRVPEASVRHALHLVAATGRVEEIAHDHFFLSETLDEVAGIVRGLGGGASGGLFTAADLRDRLDNGRKVAIQILEFFDRRGITLRHGDRREVAAPR